MLRGQHRASTHSQQYLGKGGGRAGAGRPSVWRSGRAMLDRGLPRSKFKMCTIPECGIMVLHCIHYPVWVSNLSGHQNPLEGLLKYC